MNLYYSKTKLCKLQHRFSLANISPQDNDYDTDDAAQFLYRPKRFGDMHACVIIQTSKHMIYIGNRNTKPVLFTPV